MVQDYALDKYLWTHEDFDIMGWHDSQIHGMAIYSGAFELAFDIDYIFNWVDPKPPEEWFNFWVSPCTLVFESVYDSRIEVEMDFGEGLEIAEIGRSEERLLETGVPESRRDWLWTVETQQGEIKFRAVGYKQFVRSTPILSQYQSIDRNANFPVSFSRQIGGKVT